ncbi:hypothetical protein PR202_gb18539 [Eleusine coracana subsp. coracana]|uniref:Uncharacterized protein n=1 Tax=Eleusine coracana subsp. coracana TaxID=191504 RepID=A0AAV5F6H0_ELECO|nr:hypothetical protein PR202_gb18539 [Eleusine coracana subsp. coracana]
MMFQEDANGMAVPDELCIDDISSPIAAHILDFCDDGFGDDLFAAVATATDPFPASSEDVSSSTTTTPPLCSYRDETPAAAAATAFSPLPSFDSTLTALLEQEQHHGLDNDLLPPIDGLPEAAYYPPVTDEATIEQLSQIELPGTIAEPVPQMQMSSSAPVLMPLATGYDECFTTALPGGYMGLDGALYQQTGAIIPSCNAEVSQGGFFNNTSNGNNSMVMIGEYQKMMEGEGGLTRTYSDEDSIQGALYNTAEMQVGGNNQHLANGSSESPSTLPQTELSGLEDPTFKEHMKEEDMLDSSDILAHFSGLNSYNYKYRCNIESWI